MSKWPNSSAFVKGNGSTADSGAVIDTNGYNMGSSVALQHYAAGPANDGGLTKNGSGTLTLSGTNTYTGATKINGGTLELSSTTTQTLSGAITGVGALVKSNTGTLILTGSNNFTGGLSLTGGTLAYRPTAAGTLNLGSGVLNLAAGTRIGTALGGTLGQSAITSSGAAATSGAVTVDIWGIPGGTVSSGSHDLITAASGLNSATYTLGNIYNATNFTVSGLTKTDTALSITAASATALTNAFWKGGFSGAADVWAISNGSTSSNWASDLSGTTTSLVPGAGATVTFSASGAGNQGAMTLGANMSVAGIVVNSSSAVTLNADANTLTLGTGGISVNSGAGAVTLGASIALSGDQAWNNNSSALTISGNVSNGGFALNNGGTGNTTVSGVLSGSGGLTKSGNGTLTLSGLNTFGGSTTITGGTLAHGVNDALANNAIIVNGGTFNIGSYSDSVGAVTLTAGSITGTGTLTATSYTMNNAASANVSAILAGNANLAKTEGGTLTLSGTNTYTGSTTVNGGTLALANVNALATSTLNIGSTGTQQVTFTTAGTNTYNLGNLEGSDELFIGANTMSVGAKNANASFSGAISGSGGLTKVGTGALTLNGTNAYTGSTTVSAGILYLNADAPTVHGTFVMSGGDQTYVRMLKANQFAAGVVADFTSASGAWNRFELRGKNQTFAGITTGTPLTLGGGVIQNSEYYSDAVASVTLTLNGDSNGGSYPVGGYVFNGHIRDCANGGPYALSLVKSGSGTQTLIGTTIYYTGATTVNAGTLKLSDTTGFNSNVTMNGGTLELSRSTGTWSFGKTIAAGTGTGNLVKTGAGTVTLTVANTYTGTTTINGGTLALGSSGSISSANLIVGGAGSAGAMLDVTAKSGFTLANGQKLSGIGTVNVGTGNTLTIANNSTHAVGNADSNAGVGSQSVTGNLSYASGSIFEWDLNANSNTGAGTNFDAVTGTGSLTVTSGAIFRIVLGNAVNGSDAFWNTPSSTKTWNNIFSGFTGLSGGFGTNNLVVSGSQLNGIGSFTISGSTLTWTAVPEPTSALAGLLLAAGLLRRRRR